MSTSCITMQAPTIQNHELHGTLRADKYVSQKPISIIVAMTPKRGIGMNGGLPWPHMPIDLQRFQKITTFVKKGMAGRMNAVIMGRLTWESLPEKSRPLKNRLNIVVSRSLVEEAFMDPENSSSAFCISRSLPDALHLIETKYRDVVQQVFVIGGMQLYTTALELGLVDRLYINRIGNEFPCDVFFPPLAHTSVQNEYSSGCSDSGFWGGTSPEYVTKYMSKTYECKGITFDYVILQRINLENTLNANGFLKEEREAYIGDLNKFSLVDAIQPFLIAEEAIKKKLELKAVPNVIYRHHEEFQYLDMIADVVNNGIIQNDRTGVGITSKFGCQMRFSLDQSFPLLTTKKVFWKGIVEELLWFIKGDTNANHLTEKGIRIWEPNSTREFLDSRGLTFREVGDLGPIYGFQWRHFGADYTNMHADYSGKGVDQLHSVINELRKNPDSRRIVMSAWNPAAQAQMALPPCHILCQFYVSNGELSCALYQRSADLGLGVPFNIASYSLLTLMIAHVCNLKPKEFVHFMGNTHVYNNHVEALKEQLKREPFPLPRVYLSEEVKDIQEFTAESIHLTGYNSHGRIKMQMAV